MRLTVIAAASIAILSSAVQAQSTWTEFNYPDSGFSVSFPDDPAVGHLKVKMADGKDVDETLYAVRRDDAIFRVAVIDFKDATVDGTAAIDQAVTELRARGNVMLDLPARVNGNRGRQFSLAGNDGSHSTVGIFFGDHRLYQIEGTMLASNSDLGSGELIRFQQSLRFTGNGGNFGGRGFGRPGANGGQPGPGFRGGRRFRQNPDPAQNPPPETQPKNDG
jgi:hypothetical protein